MYSLKTNYRNNFDSSTNQIIEFQSETENYSHDLYWKVKVDGVIMLWLLMLSLAPSVVQSLAATLAPKLCWRGQCCVSCEQYLVFATSMLWTIFVVICSNVVVGANNSWCSSHQCCEQYLLLFASMLCLLWTITGVHHINVVVVVDNIWCSSHQCCVCCEQYLVFFTSMLW